MLILVLWFACTGKFLRFATVIFLLITAFTVAILRFSVVSTTATSTTKSWLVVGFFYSYLSIVKFTLRQGIRDKFYCFSRNVEETAQFTHSNTAYHFRIQI